jgi:hypothetical protein
MNIAEITPKEDHVLYVKSDDGRAGLFDVTPFLESEAFEPLKNREEFERIHNGRYFIEWACGLIFLPTPLSSMATFDE